MTVTVRTAAKEDRSALIDLWVEAWQTAMPEIDFNGRRSWLAAHLDALKADDAELIVAVEAGEPIGFVTVDPHGTIDQLVVAVEHQGQGAARALIAAARVRATCRLRLAVNTENGRAVRFYERQGFTVEGRGFNPSSGLPILHMIG